MRITALSVSALARLAPRLTYTPKSAIALVWVRHASTTPSSDRQTLAKSANMFNALMGSTMCSNPRLTSTSPISISSPLRLMPVAQRAQTADSTNDMFIPPVHDPLLDYIAAVIQQHGLRARAARTVSRMLLHIYAWTRAPPTLIVWEAIMAAAPAVRVASFKYGTKVMMAPYPLTEKQRARAGLEAIIVASESRPGKSLSVRLAREMIAVVRERVDH